MNTRNQKWVAWSCFLKQNSQLLIKPVDISWEENNKKIFFSHIRVYSPTESSGEKRSGIIHREEDLEPVMSLLPIHLPGAGWFHIAEPHHKLLCPYSLSFLSLGEAVHFTCIHPTWLQISSSAESTGTPSRSYVAICTTKQQGHESLALSFEKTSDISNWRY